MRSRFPAAPVGVWLALAAGPVFAVPPAEAPLPLFFEQNHGQVDPRYPYVARSDRFSLLLSGTESSLSFKDGEALRMVLVGAQAHPQVQPLDPLPGRANYFTGSDPAG